MPGNINVSFQPRSEQVNAQEEKYTSGENARTVDQNIQTLASLQQVPVCFFSDSYTPSIKEFPAAEAMPYTRAKKSISVWRLNGMEVQCITQQTDPLGLAPILTTLQLRRTA